MVRMPINHVLAGMAIIFSLVGPSLQAAEPKQARANKTPNKPVLIESRVKGSQEQPKVLYIMPWQGVNQAIDFDDQEMQLTLPEFRPINPRRFQQEVRDFNAEQAVK